jgi:predicted nucleic acid-binding protein
VTVYLDASALVKLVAPEAESDSMASFVASHRSQSTSVVGLVEVRRAAARRPGVTATRLEDVLTRVIGIAFDPDVAAAAATIGSPVLRTLDAIHLASAAALGVDLEAFVTYDRRLAEAARALGMPVASPGA